MKKKILIVIGNVILCGSILCCCIMAIHGKAAEQSSKPTSETEIETDLFPSKPVDDEDFKDNAYVQANNKLVNAINDYEDGKITYEEYENICAEIKQEMEETGNDEMNRAEEEFREEMEEKTSEN